MDTIKLNNGVEMPQLGYGVFQVAPDEVEHCVADALSMGYRMIDTSQVYQNEEGVGRAIRKSGVPREDVFVVDKIWMSNYEGDAPARSIDESLHKLGTAQPVIIPSHHDPEITKWFMSFAPRG